MMFPIELLAETGKLRKWPQHILLQDPCRAIGPFKASVDEKSCQERATKPDVVVVLKLLK